VSKQTVIAKKGFIETIKAELAAKRERHKKLLEQIKPAMVEKLKKMNA
jgi:hypothetical protein